MRRLCEAEVDPGIPEAKGRRTPIHSAVGQEHLEVVRYLCEQAKIDSNRTKARLPGLRSNLQLVRATPIFRNTSKIILVGFRS